MATNRAYICLVRNDLPQGVLYLKDLKPNTSQRNLIYEDVPQSTYLNPTNVPQHAAITALAASDPDGLGGNDHNSTAATEYGLCAYLRDRVHVNPGGDDDSVSIAEATTIANAIIDRVIAGSTLTLTDVNVLLNATLNGADNDLEGTNGNSFGTIEDILRILAGEVYEVPANTVIELTAGPSFRSLAQRVAAIATNTDNFYSQGSFVDSTSSAYLPFRKLYNTGALKISNGEGDLSHYNAATYQYTNTADFYYAGVAEPGKTAAQDIRANTNVPATGIFRAVTIYDEAGNLI